MSAAESNASLESIDRAELIDSACVLVEGMRLDQPTFHTLYESTPPGFRAELIDGVVRMPGPVSYFHGHSHRSSIIGLGYYAENTTGVEVLDNASAILGKRSEPQPDAILRILPEHGGRTRNDKGYVVGAPELVLEVAGATRYVDRGPKRDDYQRAGVQEYIVLAANPDEVLWFAREGDSPIPRRVDEDGMIRSAAFPGLWLDPQALIRGGHQATPSGGRSGPRDSRTRGLRRQACRRQDESRLTSTHPLPRVCERRTSAGPWA